MLMDIREAVDKESVCCPSAPLQGSEHIACALWSRDCSSSLRSLGSLSVVFLFISYHSWRKATSQVLKGN